MPMRHVLAICTLLAGCDRLVVLTAVEAPEDADRDAEDGPDPNDAEVDSAASTDAAALPQMRDAASRPAENMPIDAAADRTPSDDASEDAGSAIDAGLDATLPACSGTRVRDLCWYLGVPGASCRQTCSDKGGFDPRGTVRIGTTVQGGSLRACAQVLAALGYMGNVTPGYRSDGIGLGCHLWEERDGWWLDTMPDFSPTASVSVASIACACLR